MLIGSRSMTEGGEWFMVSDKGGDWFKVSEGDDIIKSLKGNDLLRSVTEVGNWFKDRFKGDYCLRSLINGMTGLRSMIEGVTGFRSV